MMATPYRRPVARQRAAPARRFTGKPAAAAQPQDWWQRQNQYTPPAAPRTAPARPMRREGPGYRPAVAAAPQAVAAAQAAQARPQNNYYNRFIGSSPTAMSVRSYAPPIANPNPPVSGWLPQYTLTDPASRAYSPVVAPAAVVPPGTTGSNSSTTQAQLDAAFADKLQGLLGNYQTVEPLGVIGTLEYAAAPEEQAYTPYSGGGWYDYGGGGGGGSYTPTPDRIYANRNKRTLPQGTQRAQQPTMRATNQQVRNYAQVAPPARWQQLLTSWRV